MWRFEGKAYVGDALCAEAEFSAMIRNPEQRRAVSVHPTALVEDGATLGAGVEVGPFCYRAARRGAG